MKPTAPTSPLGSPVIVPENDANIPIQQKDTAELPVEVKKKSKKPPPKIQRSLSDAEYAEIFDAVLQQCEDQCSSAEENDDPIEEKEADEKPKDGNPIEDNVCVEEELSKDPFDEIIEDGKAIDELCKFDESDEKMEDKNREEVAENSDDANDTGAEDDEQEETSRHLNESTPSTSDSEASSLHEAFKSSNPPLQPKKRTFKTKSKKGKFTPKKLSFPASEKSESKRYYDNFFTENKSTDKLPLSLFTQKDSKNKECRRDWMKRRNVELIGTWVQCSDVTCLKWRYLPHVQDPADLPEYWTCNLNTDPLYDSCHKAEEEYEEDQHVFMKYTEGSVVWASMTGYPWWPAMVEVDPDFERFAECRYNANEISHYHVVFFDDKVTRAWVQSIKMRPFTRFKESCGSVKVKGHNYKKDILKAKQKASYAIGLSIKERLEEFTFARRYDGRWGKVGDCGYVGGKAKKSQKRIKKRIRTSTPKRSRSSDDDVSLSDDSDLKEFRELENAIDAILDSQEDCNSFEDLLSESNDTDFMLDSPEEPERKKMKKSDDSKKHKKSKKDKKEKKKEQKKQDGELSKEKSNDKKEISSKKSLNKPSAPKQKPVFGVPKRRSSSEKVSSAENNDSKDKVKGPKILGKTPKTLVEMHLAEEKSTIPKKKTFKPKSVVLKESPKEDLPENTESTEIDAFDKLDSDIFTMEMETQENRNEIGLKKKNIGMEKKEMTKPAIKKKKVAESESNTMKGEPKAKKKKVEESESSIKEGDLKVKKKKVTESESKSSTKDGEPKAKRKNESGQESESNKEKKTNKEKRGPKNLKKVSKDDGDKMASTKLAEESMEVNNKENKQTKGSIELVKKLEQKEEKKTKEKSKVLEVKTDNLIKQKVTKSKPEKDGKQKTKKFTAPVAKLKKPTFQAPVMSKKEKKGTVSKENNVEKSKDQKENKKISNESKQEKTKDQTADDVKDTSREKMVGKESSLRGDKEKSKDKKVKMEERSDTPEKWDKDDAKPKTAAQTQASKDEGLDDDDMMLDLEVDQEDSAAKDEDEEVAVAMPTSPTLAASGYDSDPFENEM